jgi:hypothetical protein
VFVTCYFLPLSSRYIKLITIPAKAGIQRLLSLS